MSENTNDLQLQQEMEELNTKVAETCQSAEDMMKLIYNDMPESESDELGADELDLVVGGMSLSKAVVVASTAYWDLCVKKKKKTSYTDKQIFEALGVIDKANNWVKDKSLKTIKWGLEYLLTHS